MSIVEVFYKAPHNYDYDKESDLCSVKDFGPSLTVQSDAEDVDMNVIMKRFGVTGKMPESFVAPMYGDFDQVFDFRTAQEAVINARHQFDSLPAEIRSRFYNDPQKLLDFVSDERNLDEAGRLGLLDKERYHERLVKSGSSSGDAGAPAGAGPRGDSGPAVGSPPAGGGAAPAAGGGSSSGGPKGPVAP